MIHALPPTVSVLSSARYASFDPLFVDPKFALICANLRLWAGREDTGLRPGESLFTRQPDGGWVAVDQAPAKEEIK